MERKCLVKTSGDWLLTGDKINIALIDDSALVRQVITEIIKSEKSFNLLFTASDPIFAIEKMKANWPDVIILDIEMPRMDGITFLKKIMSEHPTPVVVCSTLTLEHSETTMNALASGAVDIITKPQLGLKNFLNESSNRLIDAIQGAAKSNVKRIISITELNQKKNEKPIQHSTFTSVKLNTTEKLVAIGTSTGGTIALEYILTRLDNPCPGIVIVQHMPEKFTKAFADRLNNLCSIEVKEAQDGDRIVPGRALIAPGNYHMSVKRNGAQYIVEVHDGPLVSRHRPSVDVLFRSFARNVGMNGIALILTGMGDDGAGGMRDMFDAGVLTFAQNEESCVVFGMPKEAIRRGGVNKIIDLSEIPQIISNLKNL